MPSIDHHGDTRSFFDNNDDTLICLRATSTSSQCPNVFQLSTNIHLLSQVIISSKNMPLPF